MLTCNCQQHPAWLAQVFSPPKCQQSQQAAGPTVYSYIRAISEAPHGMLCLAARRDDKEIKHSCVWRCKAENQTWLWTCPCVLIQSLFPHLFPNLCELLCFSSRGHCVCVCVCAVCMCVYLYLHGCVHACDSYHPTWFYSIVFHSRTSKHGCSYSCYRLYLDALIHFWRAK